MRSKLCATTALTPSRCVPLAAQSRELPVPYSGPGQDDQRRALAAYLHGRVENAHCLAAGLELGHAAFHSRHHQVFDAHIGEGAARHDPVVAAARAVAVEVHKIDAVLDQIFPGGEVFLMLPAGEMWSVVTLSPKMPRGRAPLISAMRPGCSAEIVEERRLLDVGALLVPLIDLAGAGGDFVPLRILRGEIAVELAEHFRLERRFASRRALR